MESDEEYLEFRELYKLGIKKGIKKVELSKLFRKLYWEATKEFENMSNLRYELSGKRMQNSVLWKEVSRLRELNDQYWKELEYARSFIMDNSKKLF